MQFVEILSISHSFFLSTSFFWVWGHQLLRSLSSGETMENRLHVIPGCITFCMILSKMCTISGFLSFSKNDIISIYINKLLWGLSLYVKHSEQCLAHSKHSININHSYYFLELSTCGFQWSVHHINYCALVMSLDALSSKNFGNKIQTVSF